MRESITLSRIKLMSVLKHTFKDEIMSSFIFPCKGEITPIKGWHWGRNANGILISNDLNTPIHASERGVVTFNGWLTGYGKTIILQHLDNHLTLYSHLSLPLVDLYYPVSQYQVIGLMGSTGFSTQPHLYFEILQASPFSSHNPIDPLALLNKPINPES